MGKHARQPPGRRRASAQPARPSRRKQRVRPAWQEIPILVIMALVVAVLVKSFVVQAFYIPSGSMETTLHGCTGCQGDRVLVNKMSYRLGHIQRGQIVVFRRPPGSRWPIENVEGNDKPSPLAKLAGFVGLAGSSETDFVKRVIALPGDRIECCDGKGHIKVNGVAVNEPYIYQDNYAVIPPQVVPKGYLWVMGDHRGNSSDARSYGPIPISAVVGRAFVLVYPIDRFTLLKPSGAFEKARVPNVAE